MKIIIFYALNFRHITTLYILLHMLKLQDLPIKAFDVLNLFSRTFFYVLCAYFLKSLTFYVYYIEIS